MRANSRAGRTRRSRVSFRTRSSAAWVTDSAAAVEAVGSVAVRLESIAAVAGVAVVEGNPTAAVAVIAAPRSGAIARSDGAGECRAGTNPSADCRTVRSPRGFAAEDKFPVIRIQTEVLPCDLLDDKRTTTGCGLFSDPVVTSQPDLVDPPRTI